MVPEHELSFLQPLEQQLIDGNRCDEGLYFGVKITVFPFEAIKLLKCSLVDAFRRCRFARSQTSTHQCEKWWLFAVAVFR